MTGEELAIQVIDDFNQYHIAHEKIKEAAKALKEGGPVFFKAFTDKFNSLTESQRQAYRNRPNRPANDDAYVHIINVKLSNCPDFLDAIRQYYEWRRLNEASGPSEVPVP